MRDTQCDELWDFTPVISLIHSFHATSQDASRHHETPEAPAFVDAGSNYPGHQISDKGLGSKLGDFDNIWKFLGSPIESSNGYITGKGVRWRDELDGADLADNDENGDNSWLVGLTKKQRKKARRKERRKLLMTANPDTMNTAASSSENESEEGPLKPRTTNRKVIIHEILHRPLPSDDEPKTIVRILKKTKLRTDGPQSDMRSSAPRRQIDSESDALAIATTKKKKLISMLNDRFIDERPYLTHLDTPILADGNTSNIIEGIHIFIDASNIMIGFHDAIKISRSLPISTRIRRQPLDFHSLSLLLERGRPAAKRVVVGSDNFPEMEEAKLIGYETNILDRVHKAKELTPRQKKYVGGNGTQSAGSGSETTAAAQYAPEKWVEQAVDEILHLKMMESVVDAAEPATMVLATGDAAEAEYSGGFLKMAERALAKGWKVELACWKQNMSGAYKRREFRQKWGERFKVIEMDDFVEVLLGGV